MKSVRQHIVNQCFLKYTLRQEKGFPEHIKPILEEGLKKHEDYYKREAVGAIIETSRSVIHSGNTITFTPDIIWNGQGTELKFTRAKVKNLPYPKDVRQVRFYAVGTGKTFELKYYDMETDMLKFKMEITKHQVESMIVWRELLERSKKWFEGFRDRNPFPEECKWCEYKSGRCWQWIQEQKDANIGDVVKNSKS